MLLIDGAGVVTPVTVNPYVPDDWPSGLLTRTVHVPASLPLLNWYTNWLLDMNVSFDAVLSMFEPVGGSNVSDAPFWKLLPLIVIVWLLDDAGYDDGDTPLIDGAGIVTPVTVNAYVPDDCPSGLLTHTVHVPASLLLLNW